MNQAQVRKMSAPFVVLAGRGPWKRTPDVGMPTGVGDHKVHRPLGLGSRSAGSPGRVVTSKSRRVISTIPSGRITNSRPSVQAG